MVQVPQEFDDRETPLQSTIEPTLPTPLPYVQPAPFPQRLAKARLDKRYGKFLQLVKDIHLKFPFLQVVTEIPSFARFLKDLTTNRNKTEGVINLSEQCSAVILKQLPPKLDDPGSFSICIYISSLAVDNALCDLGASVSLMPFSVYQRLPNVGSLLQTSMTLQLADRSIRHPKGIVKDIPVFVGNLVFPCDFVVMDIPENTRTPIILVKLCLATAGAIIDVKRGKLTLEVGEEKMVFELQKHKEGASFENFKLINELTMWPFAVGNHVVRDKGNQNDNDLGSKVRGNNVNVFGRAYKGSVGVS
ncbi:unnamed protein product [Amaranthus hypochondriacus]